MAGLYGGRQADVREAVVIMSLVTEAIHSPGQMQKSSTLFSMSLKTAPFLQFV